MSLWVMNWCHNLTKRYDYISLTLAELRQQMDPIIEIWIMQIKFPIMQ